MKEHYILLHHFENSYPITLKITYISTHSSVIARLHINNS